MRFDNLTLRLGGQTVLNGVSHRFERGRLTALIGPNGSGKTSLIKALLRLLPLETGAIWLDGVDITRLPPSRLSARIAYLPQERQAHWPIAISRLVMLGRQPHMGRFARPTSQDEAAVRHAMQITGLEGSETRALHDLSGGEQARALLARALATQAGWLMADEPVASLDPYHQIGVMQALKAEAAKGCGVVAVLHDLSLAARYADHLVLMQDGRIVASGTAADVLRDDNLARVFRIRAERIGEGLVPIGQA